MVRHPLVARIVEAYDAARTRGDARLMRAWRVPALHLSLQMRRRAAPRASCRATASRAGCAPRCEAPAEITVRIVDADEGRALNRDYRGKDYATNVLTFDYAARAAWSWPTWCCARRWSSARRARSGMPLQAHYAHLLVHGTLHAQGFDHETRRADAERWRRARSALLPALGFADPYAPLTALTCAACVPR